VRAVGRHTAFLRPAQAGVAVIGAARRGGEASAASGTRGSGAPPPHENGPGRDDKKPARWRVFAAMVARASRATGGIQAA